jgi:hypothetical protein
LSAHPALLGNGLDMAIALGSSAALLASSVNQIVSEPRWRRPAS